MNALPSNVVDFKLPKKPKVKEKEALPDQRRMTIMPIRAITDKRITDGMFRTLALVCSYVNRAGITQQITQSLQRMAYPKCSICLKIHP